MRRALVALIGLLFLAVAPVFAQEQAANVERPTWSVGDTWTYRSGNIETSWTVVSVTSDSYEVQLVGSDGWKAVQHLDYNLLFTDAIYFHPNWPLAQGKLWQFTFQRTYNANTLTAHTDAYSVIETVTGWESITVPAGTFQTVRIHGNQCNGSIRVYSNGTPQIPCGDFDVWYSPDIKYVVKITWIGERYWHNTTPRELVSYRVAK